MLPNIPLFSDLEEAELKALSSKAVTRHYPRNTIIINEGDISDSLYCILSGRLPVKSSVADAAESPPQLKSRSPSLAVVHDVNP